GREKVLEVEDVESLAREFDFSTEIAVIDLDAALSKGDNTAVIKKILKIGECRVGGGIRDIGRAREFLSCGAKKIIFSSRVFENDRIDFRFLEDAAERLGRERIIISVDSVGENIYTRGWTHNTNINLFEAAEKLSPFCSEFLFTCISNEGTMQGIDRDIVKRLRSVVSNRLVVAGGVASLDEIRFLSETDTDVQLGMALYTGKIRLRDAFIESVKYNSEGLIPTIAQDNYRRILMLAYSDRESLAKTFETKKMHYYSRSRKRLWQKGEESGNFQEVVRLRADCDRDTLLSTVIQKNYACHTGSYSCFGDKTYDINELYEVVRERIKEKNPKSYTASLSDTEVRAKIMEEALEVVKSDNRDNKVWECADLLYFLTVFMAKEGISPEEVYMELRRRRFK
ncbi:MAG: bifunctional phosphoribosyl-AMP cyclohydrolase/phosphoribosyl-ATP diphosphatase HisIE, partial [Deltaproteobacteria bacterium]|nr:bifunctional phosphoribosyl-AMP cyclohydrolase/phosphoribosyl-ATP diphosphatase HisIE [Deltaproteobacteria bacterium]